MQLQRHDSQYGIYYLSLNKRGGFTCILSGAIFIRFVVTRLCPYELPKYHPYNVSNIDLYTFLKHFAQLGLQISDTRWGYFG